MKAIIPLCLLAATTILPRAQNIPFLRSWSVPGLIEVSSAAVSHDGRIYIGAVGSSRPDSDGIPGKLLVFNTNGAIYWSRSLGPYAYGSPSIDERDRIYIGTGYTSNQNPGGEVVLGAMKAFKPDGTLDWEFKLSQPVFGSAAIDLDGTAYFGALDNYFYALRLDGSLKWKSPTGYGIVATPAIAGDGTIYCGSVDRHLYAFSADGAVKWSVQCTGTPTSVAISDDGTVFFGAGVDSYYLSLGDTRIYAVNPDGSVQWRFLTQGFINAAPVIAADGTVIAGSSDNNIYALNRDGTQKWIYHTDGPINGSPAVTQDGTIFAPSDDQNVHVLSRDGNLLQKIKTPNVIHSAATIASSGIVYVGSSNRIFAIGESNNAALTGWPMFGKDVRHSGRQRVLPPTGPTGAFASAGTYTNKILVTWDPAPTLVTYEVWRGLQNDFSKAERVAQFLTDTHFDDVVASRGITYYYWVKARNGVAVGPPSLSTSGFAPAAPVGAKIWAFDTGNQIVGSPAIAHDGTVYFGTTTVDPLDQSNYSYFLYAFDADGTLQWKAALGGRAVSSPSVGEDGTIFIGCGDQQLYAFNPDGSIKWQAAAVPGIANLRGEMNSSPAIAVDGTVYIGATDNNLYAFNTNGILKWFYPTEVQYSASPVNSSPAIGADGTVYITAVFRVFAIKPDGSLLWIYNSGGSFDTSPAIGTDGTIFVAGSAGSLHAINTDGSVKWISSTGSSSIGSAVVSKEGTVYVGSAKGELFAFASDGSLKWKYGSGAHRLTTPTVAQDGTIYFGGDNNTFYAVDSEGVELWRFSTSGAIYSSPSINARGRIYFGCNDDSIYCLNGASPLGKEAWPAFHANSQHQGRSGSTILPVVAPTGISASSTNNAGFVSIHWNSVPWATSYDLWRSASADFALASPIATNISGSTTFLDLTALPGVLYYYRVKAANSLGGGDFSNITQGSQSFRKWSANLDGEMYGPASQGADGTIYATSVGTDASPGRLYAFTANGTLRWEITAASHIYVCPSISSDGTIHFGCQNGDVYAVNPNGEPRWIYRSPSVIVGLAVSQDSTVYTVSVGSKTLDAIASDGHRLWSYTLPYYADSVVIGKDGTVYVQLHVGALLALNPNGSLKWRVTRNGGDSTACAIDGSDIIYFGSGQTLNAVTPEGTRKWALTLPVELSGSPVMSKEGNIVFGDQFGDVYEVSPAGVQLWKFAGSALIRRTPASTPTILADGSIYVAYSTLSTKMVLLNPNGTLNKIFETSTWMDSLFNTAPLVTHDGLVILGSKEGQLIAFEETVKPAETAWPMLFHDTAHTGSFLGFGTPPLRIGFDILSSTNGIGLRIQNLPEGQWQIDASTDLQNWQSLTNLLGPSSSVALIGSTVRSGAIRFFRLHPQ